jgi:hypothetical protein
VETILIQPVCAQWKVFVIGAKTILRYQEFGSVKRKIRRDRGSSTQKYYRSQAFEIELEDSLIILIPLHLFVSPLLLQRETRGSQK